jgi:hypothetical protein
MLLPSVKHSFEIYDFLSVVWTESKNVMQPLGKGEQKHYGIEKSIHGANMLTYQIRE